MLGWYRVNCCVSRSCIQAMGRVGEMIKVWRESLWYEAEKRSREIGFLISGGDRECMEC